MLKEAPAVWLVGEPELPVPVAKVWPPKVTIILATPPTTSVRAPQPEGAESPVRMLVPDSVILVLAARGVPAVGRTWIFCQVSVLAVAPVLVLVIVAVMVEPSPATVALKELLLTVPLMFWEAVVLPVT